MTDRPRRRWRDAAAITLLSLVVAGLTAEGFLRLRCTYCTWTEANQGRVANPYELPPSPYWLRRPNQVTHYAQTEYDFELRTNSLGLRDRDHPVAKAPGEVRLLAVGDSFTEGQGAPFEETWLRVLEARLAAANPSAQIRVMCAGVAGSDPVYGYRLLADRLLRYEPDLVVLVVNQSDILDLVVRGGMERYGPDGEVRSRPTPDIWWLYRRSHFARFVLFEFFDYTHHLIPRSERRQLEARALDQLQALIAEFDVLLAARGARFALIVHPSQNEFHRNRYGRIAVLRDAVAAGGIAVVDVNPLLQERHTGGTSQPEDFFWPTDGHFTAAGYRHFADAVWAGLCPLWVDLGLRCAE